MTIGHVMVMGNKRGGITAGALLRKLAIDPDYQARRATRDRELARIAEQHDREQQPLLKELATAGVIVRWVGELLEIPAPDPRMYPVLLDHITRPYTPWLLEWIGRGFRRRSARAVVWDELIHLITTHVLKEGAVNRVMAAISVMSRPGDLPVLIDLLSDRSLGPSRIYLVRNLMRSRKPEARLSLLRNQVDPDLASEITARFSRSRG